MKVWGIYYIVRRSSLEKWNYSDPTGPIGIYGMNWNLTSEEKNFFSRRPIFFRTRKQARETAKKKMAESNLSWEWVRYFVKPFELTWRKL